MSVQSSDLKAQPIGVFDSGVGGISVLRHIHAALPQEDLLYIADSHYAPYGTRTSEEILARCWANADFLLAQGVKMLVVACNTATAAAIAPMRRNYALPIIGMEPAVKPAVQMSKTGVIGVLATAGTLKSAQFAALLENYGQNVTVVTQACVGLVECIERGELQAEATQQLLRHYCEPLLAAGADTIVLGCTHYPFVREQIAAIVGAEVTLIDTGAAVAKQVKRVLTENALLNDCRRQHHIRFWSNSSYNEMPGVIERLWGFDEMPVIVDFIGP